MKRLVILLLCLVAGMQVFAQSPASPAPSPTSSNDPARTATDQLVAKYKLDADQAKQMYGIQQRKLRNLAEIAPLQQSDPAMYRLKMQNVQKGTLASIRRILRTEEQVTLYRTTQAKVRTQQAEKRKEMTQTGAAAADIDAALLLIYEE